MPAADINEGMHLTLLRQLIDSVRAVNGQLNTINSTNLDLVQRLTRIESNRLEDQVKIAIQEHDQLVTRVAELEKVRQQSVGAFSIFVWVKDAMPWLVAMAMGGYAYVTKK